MTTTIGVMKGVTVVHLRLSIADEMMATDADAIHDHALALALVLAHRDEEATASKKFRNVLKKKYFKYCSLMNNFITG